MIRPGAIIMTVLMTAVAVGVYFGLDYLPQGLVPGKEKKAPAAPPTAVAAAPAATARQPTTAVAPDGNQSAMVTEQDLAEEPEASAPAAAAPSAESTVDYDPAPGGAGVPVEEPADEVASAPAAEEPDTPAESEPEPAPAAKAPPAKQPTRVAKAEPADTASRPQVRRAPEADSIKPWWPDPAKMSANQLKLQYAGQVQHEQAIALLFSAPLNLDTLNQHAQVRNAGGDTVTAPWELAKNPRMAVLRGVKPGRYTVILAPTVAGTNGFMLGTALHGPVYIQGQ